MTLAGLKPQPLMETPSPEESPWKELSPDSIKDMKETVEGFKSSTRWLLYAKCKTNLHRANIGGPVDLEAHKEDILGNFQQIVDEDYDWDLQMGVETMFSLGLDDNPAFIVRKSKIREDLWGRFREKEGGTVQPELSNDWSDELQCLDLLARMGEKVNPFVKKKTREDMRKIYKKSLKMDTLIDTCKLPPD